MVSQLPGIGRVARFDGYQAENWSPEICRDCHKNEGKVTKPAFVIIPEGGTYYDSGRYWLCDPCAVKNGVVMLAQVRVQRLF